MIPQLYKESGKRKSGRTKSGDYAIAGPLFLDDQTDFVVNPEESYAGGNERNWDYYREDPIFHVFHALLHMVIKYQTSRKNTSHLEFLFKVYQHTYPRSRVNERFYYTHGQMTNRYTQVIQ